MTTHKTPTWIGRILSGLVIAFLALDAVMKLLSRPEVLEAHAQLGLPLELAPLFGAVLALCVVLYAMPRTAPIGAVLLTGYLGGAILVHARLGDPLLTHTLAPLYFGAAIWLGLYLRDPRVQALLAPRR